MFREGPPQMLTDTGYYGAFAVYLTAAFAALVLFNLWFLPRASLGLRALLSLPLASLLMTPAYLDPEAGTLAPALIVTAFQWLITDADAAAHALRPLVLFTGIALAVGCVLFLGDLSRRRRRSRDLQANRSS